jgi:hypothetical protein
LAARPVVRTDMDRLGSKCLRPVGDFRWIHRQLDAYFCLHKMAGDGWILVGSPQFLVRFGKQSRCNAKLPPKACFFPNQMSLV